MTNKQKTIHRRTALGSILAGIIAGLAGCTSSGDGGDDRSADGAGDVIQSVDVDGLELVIELERDTIDQFNVVDPSGELFAKRAIESGVSHTTIEVGTDYPPGEYELLGLNDDEPVETTTVTLEPDLELTELRLAREYPEEMYEGASDSQIDAEAILSVTNQGTGPTAVTALRFEGDVPFPTHESYDENNESGIYDPENDFGADADSITIPADETVLVYSNSLPFLPVNVQTKCNSIGRDGRFTVHLSTTHNIANITLEYLIHYLSADSEDCVIEIEETA
ncbi:hypothetical protein [Natronorubrum sulfidifaciens]|uniref:Uncharacterized protein n=1 Tax=Natronorubrum sulfidifaciens JCM 14089 TaxID=1230460 RepID=L9VWR6_9EURY|nr:hypothetical protein [Natronorubrum sulfidifaciens]ELY41609.1 hypothetical protein C495_16410 [Natronorubrum sulfidifaciens JCM 14089]